MIKKILSDSGNQIVMLLIFLGLGFILMLFFSLRTLRSVKNINTLYENIVDISNNTVELKDKTEYFFIFKHSDKFYETNTDESVEDVYMLRYRLQETLNTIKNNNYTDKSLSDSYIKKCNDILQKTNKIFYELITVTTEIGNKKYGLINRLNFNEKRVIQLFGSDINFTNEFLELIHLKELFFQTQNPEIKDKFILYSEKLLNQLQQVFNATDESGSKLLVDVFADYVNTFKLYIEAQNKIGTDFQYGLKYELKNSLSEMVSENSNLLSAYKNKVSDLYSNLIVRFIIFIILTLIILALVIYVLIKFFTKNFITIEQQSQIISFSGKKQNFIFTVQNYFKELIDQISILESDMKTKKNSIERLINEDFDNMPAYSEKDSLGKAIFDLHKKLKEDKQQFVEKSDKQKTEDKKNTGIALFGRILRRHVGNISTLTEELISELVHFTGSEIGGIYVREKKGDEFILNLRASYAYNEKKMIQKEIQFGEGLVGTCAVDKSTLFIDKTDENYIKIISGFGHSKPSSILISPIVVENEVFGVIELASLKLYNQDDIDFIELFAEDIAYTLSYLLASENR